MVADLSPPFPPSSSEEGFGGGGDAQHRSLSEHPEGRRTTPTSEEEGLTAWLNL